MPNETPLVPQTNRHWWSLEDWTSVWIGILSLILIVAGYRPVAKSLKWSDVAALSNIFSFESLTGWIGIGIATLIISSLGVLIMRDSLVKYVLAFPAVFLLSFFAQLIAGNSTVSTWGLESVIFALALGLLISNSIGTPDWLVPAVRTEFFIKTGLIMMGATILFGEILQAGALGILQSVLVVMVVWYFSFWLSKKFRLDDEFATMLATAVSICGVSAAIAACGAIEGDRRKLSYVTSIVLIVAVPMIVIQPWLIKYFNIPDVVAGAWLGGTLDTTGSVVAAGELISETATKVGTIVKFSQNVLLGIAAFLLSLWWSARSPQENKGSKASVIWSRFPKFVLGFVGASIFFSFALDASMVKTTKPIITMFRNVWFALAFVSIGLETRFTDLLRMEEGRPFWSFLGAQSFNVVWTLILAWLIFGGVFFAVPNL